MCGVTILERYETEYFTRTNVCVFLFCHVSCGKEFFLSKVNVNDNQNVHGNFEYIYTYCVLFNLKNSYLYGSSCHEISVTANHKSKLFIDFRLMPSKFFICRRALLATVTHKHIHFKKNMFWRPGRRKCDKLVQAHLT